MTATIEFYAEKVKELLEEYKAGKMEFCKGMKMTKRLTQPKDGSPYGDIPYAPWDKFKPYGGEGK